MFSFRTTDHCKHTAARAGWLSTPHGLIQTPAFMPVGTRGAIKGITTRQLREAGAEIMLANTYHLALRPGEALVEKLGGLHKFIGWDGPILTDSGGFQVFSLDELRRLDDKGVTFRSTIDGSWLRLTPERAIQIQNSLGADIIMALDVCPPTHASTRQMIDAVRRTLVWAEQCKKAHQCPEQWLFAIIQGGLDDHQRWSCLKELAAMDFPGYAIGGLSVGEPPAQMHRILQWLGSAMPAAKPRYLMGVGRPIDIAEAVACGLDMFDCVMPTRNGRNGYAFTSAGPIRLRNNRWTQADEPLDCTCGCYTCGRFTKAYLRHLVVAGEMLGPILVSLHNLHYYQDLMAKMRQAIRAGTFAGWLEQFRASPAACAGPNGQPEDE
jgi:queuine tRNA-ribosyltransferase